MSNHSDKISAALIFVTTLSGFPVLLTIFSETPFWNPHLQLCHVSVPQDSNLYPPYFFLWSLIFTELNYPHDLNCWLLNLYFYSRSCPWVSEFISLAAVCLAIIWMFPKWTNTWHSNGWHNHYLSVRSESPPPVFPVSANGTIILHHSKQKAFELSLMPTFCLTLHIQLISKPCFLP